MMQEEKITHCIAALQTADIIFEVADELEDQGRLFLEDYRDDDPNPCSQQTAKGLLLAFWGSRPVSIITPWGNYYFAGCYEFNNRERKERQIWKELIPLLKAKLGLVLYKSKSEIEIDTIHGDLFAIGRQPSKISIPSLPFPEERVYSSFISHSTAKEQWLKLVEIAKVRK